MKKRRKKNFFHVDNFTLDLIKIQNLGAFKGAKKVTQVFLHTK
jgi:hypothetical protein